MSDVTRILSQIEPGDPQAAEQLLPLVYDELRKLAAAKLAHEKPGQTLQATALVHEAYLRLVGDQGPGIGSQELRGQRRVMARSICRLLSPDPDPAPSHSRGHFFAAAAEAMRRILVDAGPQQGAAQAGRRPPAARHRRHRRGRFRRRPISCWPSTRRSKSCAATMPRVYELVKLRYFAGLNVEQAAEALGISAPTAYRHWNYARAWLHGELLGSAES